MTGSSADVYQVEGAMEEAVVNFLATSNSFALHFLPRIKAELFSNPQAEEIVDIFLRYFKARGKPPGGMPGASNLVVQWYNKGKITKSVKNACLDYLLDCQFTDMEEEVCQEQFAMLVRDWKHYKASLKAVELAMQRKPISEIVDDILDADSVMVKKDTTHVYGSVDQATKWINIIKKSGQLDRMPTGIPAWDARLKGGLPRKNLGIIVGGTGSGKSTVLTQLCASALLRGYDAAYISLEDDDATVSARVFAPIAGVPLHLAIQRADALEPYILKTCRRLKTVPGNFYFEEFPPGITVGECLTSVDEKLEELGAKPDVYYFDYLDRFGGGKTKQDNEYKAGEDITQAIRNYIRKKNAYGWTAVQNRRLATSESSKHTDENSVAGSMHKARITDVLINLQFNKNGEEKEVRAFFSKNRGAQAGVTTAWQTLDYSYGTVFDSPDFTLLSKDVLAKDRAFADLIEFL